MSDKNILDELKENFLESSLDTNIHRAFPSVKDGLKDGQRACIWEMYLKKYTSAKPHVKSAKVSGGVCADLWPHSNVAIYETFARMSQPFMNNLPEVDFHGANGNIILGGDAIASDRYTEVRLAKITEEGMLQGVNKNNVPMQLNFSEDLYWPKVLPAVFPRLLVNGAQGIGVSLANYWTLHNFSETATLITKYMSTGILEADTYYPDFPTGGVIVNKSELAGINKTGKGKILLEGKYNIKGKEIIFYELPYQVYVEQVMEEIKAEIDKENLTGIKAVHNKCDKKNIALSIEVDNKTKPENMVNSLFAYTSLRKQYNVNQNGIVSQTPVLLNLKETIDIYIEHNLECIKKEFEFDLEKSIKRMNILEGLKIALEDIDNIIKVIKDSSSAAIAKESLVKKYNFNEEQVKSILDMKLSKLANLEKVEVFNELDCLKDSIKGIKNIISNQEEQKRVLSERLLNLQKKFGTPRQTDVIDKELSVRAKKTGKSQKADVLPEDIVVCLTKQGYLKRFKPSSFTIQNRNGKGIKNKGEEVISHVNSNTVDTILLFSSLGKMYKLNGSDIKEEIHTSELLKLSNDEKIMNIISLSNHNNYNSIVFITKNGLIKKSNLDLYLGTGRSLTGTKAITLKEGDVLINISFVKEDDKIAIATEQGKIISFELNNINNIGKIAVGIKAINLEENDSVKSTFTYNTEKEFFVFYKNGNGKRVSLTELPLQNRGGKGVSLGNEIAMIAVNANNAKSILVIGETRNITIPLKDIPLSSRTSLGVSLIKKDNLISVIFL